MTNYLAMYKSSTDSKFYAILMPDFRRAKKAIQILMDNAAIQCFLQGDMKHMISLANEMILLFDLTEEYFSPDVLYAVRVKDTIYSIMQEADSNKDLYELIPEGDHTACPVGMCLHREMSERGIN